MSDYDAQPARALAGTIAVPGDKSISHRAVMLAGIADGNSELRGFLPGEDCLATISALRALGVNVHQDAPDRVRVEGVGLHGLRGASKALDMGNAGTAMRLYTGLLCAQQFDSELFGDSSLMKRPMERVAAPLRLMGARIRTSEGKPPILINGVSRLAGIEYTLPVASAQVKSALLLAGLYAQGRSCITEPAVSRDHSERMMATMGVKISGEGRRIVLDPPSRLNPQSIDIPGDFSSAAFFMVAGLLAARDAITIENVGINPTRTGLLTILRQMGGDIELSGERMSGTEPVANLIVRRSALKGIHVPAELVPLAIDEFPVLFIAAACARGETLITGAQELRVKESDRLATMSEGLRMLGIEHDLRADGMRISGSDADEVFGGGSVDSLGDHRIAMSFAVASVRAKAAIRIRDIANVATSFPGFPACARTLGMRLTES